jgi:AcrR family transcriptional regulator
MAPDERTPLELPMLAARPERGDAAMNRLRILAAARSLLAERGPAGLSMDAVAAAAGVGKGTVFRRFGDRAGLMEALVSDYMQGFQDAFLSGPPPLGPGADPRERLETFIVELLTLQRDHLPLALAAGTTIAARDRVYGALLLHARTLIREIHPTIDPDVTAAMLLGAIAPPVLDRMPDAARAELGVILASARALLRGLISG